MKQDNCLNFRFHIEGAIILFIFKAMTKKAVLFSALPVFCSCLIYIDRLQSDFNPKLVNMTINFTHNNKGESVVNTTFLNHVTITKLTVYVSLRVPENKNDRECKRELVKTVVDLDKVFKGLQTSSVVNGFIRNILQYLDFEVKLPFLPVSSKIKDLRLFA